ncbi:hypothetical protein PENSPDRAFT_667773 [Peniophora sp. CONT]|nr:hypothetical protein PENSPDRAFT_667773 [Peniophora sp. CONT]
MAKTVKVLEASRSESGFVLPIANTKDQGEGIRKLRTMARQFSEGRSPGENNDGATRFWVAKPDKGTNTRSHEIITTSQSPIVLRHTQSTDVQNEETGSVRDKLSLNQEIFRREN